VRFDLQEEHDDPVIRQHSAGAKVRACSAIRG
jgi:hypothetical protein